MLVVILLADQLLFRPLVAWADRFRFEQEAGVVPPRSWVLTTLRRSRLVAYMAWPFRAAFDWWRRIGRGKPRTRRRTLDRPPAVIGVDADRWRARPRCGVGSGIVSGHGHFRW